MFTAYAKIDGINGEARAKNFEKQIEVLSFSHSIHHPTTARAGAAAGRAAGRSEHSDFSIVKVLDASSPILAKKCSTGAKIPSVVITLLRPSGDGKQEKFMEYKFTDVIVSNYRPGGSGQGDGLPLEEVSFAYDKIEWTYTIHGGGNVAEAYEPAVPA
jgi:type VI secretion system secreted protein Hcp